MPPRTGPRRDARRPDERRPPRRRDVPFRPDQPPRTAAEREADRTEEPEKPREPRRALTNVGGASEKEGDEPAVSELAAALQVLGTQEGGEEAARAHVHGFHTYPARLHPDTAARLVQAFVPKGGVLLDPFCGSGTVLVEGLLAGRSVLGTDLNPLAVLLAKVKTAPFDPAHGDRVVARAKQIAERADGRRKAKAGATRRFPPEDTDLYDPHVLLELDGLRAGIEETAPGQVKDALSVVLAALLVKVSKKRGDTADKGQTQKRVAGGFTIRFFVTKAEDLVRRRAELAERIGPDANKARATVSLDDATRLRAIESRSVDAIISSPPYAATYDYLEHHALRLRWLGLSAEAFAEGEMGARRTYARLEPREARQRWRDELARFLEAAARVTKPDAAVILVLADSALRGRNGSAIALRADDILLEAAEGLPFHPEARAAQARPHFHVPTAAAFQTRPRHEHALLLRRLRG